ncbi:TolC family protein [Lentimicrobium sp. S6]|uniref:TolC family protein n=1 Tax=Lentimicrobium sp. S6 TaxID=2735872 RepID=UPI0015547829|nr:TolC family protein [Lentimicrobium sp. S6]NPD47953.1 TolC family protein [Lentimicrobium sp. S6]
MNRIIVLLLSFLSITSAFAQSNVLDSYIQIALDSNLALKQKEYSYQKSLEALKEAKRMYLPSVSFEARYSVSEGGRTMSIPTGDLLNPAYNNLNQINETLNPGAPKFPEVQNTELNFIRSPDQETKLVATMPIFNNSIIQNHKIKEGFTEVDKINVEIYKRELVKEVKEAYVKYLQAQQSQLLYTNTLTAVNQNLKNRQSLYKNDKITIDEVYSAEAQVKQIEKFLVEANKNNYLAIAWFNYLLNREFNTEIIVDQTLQLNILSYNLEDLKMASVTNREELKQLDEYLEIQTNTIRLEQGMGLPQINVGAQYGFQGSDYEFNNEGDFASIGFNLKWDLFTSGQRKSKVNQAKIDRSITENKKQEVERQVQLEVIEAYYSIQTAMQGIELAQDELKNYKKSYDLVEKKYQQGMVNYLEYSNALNNKLDAENTLIIAQYGYLLEEIKLERLTSSYQF